nr:DUF6702 family protein [uncultured Lacibacter sp.]
MVAVLYKRLIESKPVVDSGKSLAGSAPSAMIRRLFLLMAIGLLLTAFSAHPYYMSVTEFEYKPAEKEVQVSCKIFTDDMEETLKKEYSRKVDILNAAQKKENEQLLYSYLQKHLRLQLDGKPAALQMIGFEQEGEAVWIYLVTSNTAAFKSATVFNDLLYSYREDQINIVHFKNKNERKSYRFNYPSKQFTFNW